MIYSTGEPLVRRNYSVYQKTAKKPYHSIHIPLNRCSYIPRKDGYFHLQKCEQKKVVSQALQILSLTDKPAFLNNWEKDLQKKWSEAQQSTILQLTHFDVLQNGRSKL